MYLYIYKGFKGGRDRQQMTDRLVLQAAELFAGERGISLEGYSREIIRSEKGKPSFKELPLAFSVSHTGEWWVCLITDGDGAVGVDIQQEKKVNAARVAGRYFTEDEKQLLESSSEEAFFRIWTRKEAYAKYTGKGITAELAGVSTIEKGRVEFTDFQLSEDVKGSCCVKQKEDLCLRMI